MVESWKMSTASESSNGTAVIAGSRIVPTYEPPESDRKVDGGWMEGERRPPVSGGFEEMKVDSSSFVCPWSEMSSDLSSGKESDGGDDADEVQSSNKGPLDSMDELAESLLQRKKGLSSYYEGRTKAFVNLADALTLSMEDLAVPKRIQKK